MFVVFCVVYSPLAAFCFPVPVLILPSFYPQNEIGYPSENVSLINVNREMIGMADEVNGMEINFVPTIIFYRNDEEVGRIIEMPYESLEKDMLEIVKK